MTTFFCKATPPDDEDGDHEERHDGDHADDDVENRALV